MKKILTYVIISILGTSGFSQVFIPAYAGSISDGSGGALLNAPYSVHVSGNYVYVTSHDALRIIDRGETSLGVAELEAMDNLSEFKGN